MLSKVVYVLASGIRFGNQGVTVFQYKGESKLDSLNRVRQGQKFQDWLVRGSWGASGLREREPRSSVRKSHDPDPKQHLEQRFKIKNTWGKKKV